MYISRKSSSSSRSLGRDRIFSCLLCNPTSVHQFCLVSVTPLYTHTYTHMYWPSRLSMFSFFDEVYIHTHTLSFFFLLSYSYYPWKKEKQRFHCSCPSHIYYWLIVTQNSNISFPCKIFLTGNNSCFHLLVVVNDSNLSWRSEMCTIDIFFVFICPDMMFTTTRENSSVLLSGLFAFEVERKRIISKITSLDIRHVRHNRRDVKKRKR